MNHVWYKYCLMQTFFVISCLVGFLPLEGTEKTQRILEAERGFQMRWEVFESENAPFDLWQREWTEEGVKKGFESLTQARFALYFVDPPKGYRWKEVPTSTELYQSGSVANMRVPSLVTFAYNLASPRFNATIVSIQGLRFLAMEAPTERNVSDFFQVLDDYGVTDLVRLTPIYEEKRQRDCCFPYWEGREDIHPITGRSTLHITEDREIHYFPIDSWVNHKGEDPKRLLALVNAVRNASNPEDKMIAVHCHMGVGRTGTFIAAYALIHAIDNQLIRGRAPQNIEISVEKVVWELSLQRPFLVTHHAQYKTLYELVSLYLQKMAR